MRPAEGGNFGARPKPPHRASKSARYWASAVFSSGMPTEVPGAGRAFSRRYRASSAPCSRSAAWSLLPEVGDAAQQRAEAGTAVAVLGREVGAGEERLLVRGQEHGHRPAAVPLVHGQGGRHVDVVEVGALLAVHLDGDEVLVHERGDLFVLEGLALHHVAPVAGGVADAEQDRLVLRARPRQRLLAPGMPVHRVVGVLQEVGAGAVGESVGVLRGRRHVLSLVCWTGPRGLPDSEGMLRARRWGSVGRAVIAASLAAAYGCATPAPAADPPPPPLAAVETRLYLIGDAGAPAPGDPVFKALAGQLAVDPKHSVVVFLGDNIYPAGLPPEGSPSRKEAERRLDAQIDLVRGRGGDRGSSSPATTTGVRGARTDGMP